ncbi:hypothetical protein P9112_009026 [Eukaryota sp. TZLM1-RC]
MVLSDLDIEKHLKFFFLRICYSGKFTHILRSTSPSISLEFCKIFNELRTKFLANLLDIDYSFLRSHIFCSTELGGLDFHKSKYLCKAAFISGGKNFVFEFLKRFPENQHLIECCSEIECISPHIWSNCFPADIQEIPPRSLISLKFAYAKLQKKLLIVRRLSSENEDENTFGKRRADLITPGSDGVIKVVDVVTVDVCKDSAIDFAKRDETPLCFAEKSKIKKYNEPLSQLGRVEHVKNQLVPFAVSLFGNIGISGIKFLEGFKSLIKERAGKELNFNFWHNRIVFSILKAIPEMLTKALLQLGIEYENRALKRFDDVDACIEDIEF